MRLFLVRHATAEVTAASDYERELIPKGVDQSRKVGGFCQAHGLVPGAILTSPYPRARQTAEIVGEALGGLDVTVTPWLSAGAEPEQILDEIEGYAKLESVMLVGHEPDFSEVVAHLIGATGANAVKIKKASLTIVDVRSFCEGGGELQMVVPVRFMA